MTTRTGITRSLAALAATSLLALGLTACSGGSSDEAFCKAGKDRSADISFNASGGADSFQKLADVMDIEPPKAIADDWKTVRDAYIEMAEVYKGVDIENPDAEAMAKVNAVSEKMTSGEFTKALNNISAWNSEHCK